MSLSKPNDFAEDVLETLKRRRVKLYGCPPWYLEHKAGGDIKIWFYGYRKGAPWAGGVTIMKRDDLDNAFVRGDSSVFAQVCEQIVDKIHADLK